MTVDWTQIVAVLVPVVGGPVSAVVWYAKREAKRCDERIKALEDKFDKAQEERVSEAKELLRATLTALDRSSDRSEAVERAIGLNTKTLEAALDRMSRP